MGSSLAPCWSSYRIAGDRLRETRGLNYERECKPMARELTAKDAKIVQYLNEAYGKEKQLETALQAHIAMTTRAPYKKRLQQHLRETKDHAKQLQRRIKKLGGKAEVGADLPGPDAVTETVANVAGRAVAMAQGPIHALRGTGEAEKMLKNA